MSRREAWLTAGGIFLVALIVRAVAAVPVEFPKPEDSAYYVGVARNLVEGRGLVSDALWSYATPPLVFPRPAFEVWLPLPSLLFALPLALVGGAAPDPPRDGHAGLPGRVRDAGRAAVRPGLATGCRRRGRAGAATGARARTLAIGTGLTTAVYLPLLLHSIQPDSTILFGVLALSAALLMTRVLRDPRGARLLDPRLVAIGLLLGLAAITRNEAAWLALAWAWLAIRRRGLPLPERLRMIGIAAAGALVVFAPWALRDWLVFGSPLPGQTVSNALSVTGFDIFAWNDPPTLSRYLAVGPARLLEMRVEGAGHNIVNVLVLLGIPLSVLGLLALPWQARDRALRPVALLAATTFLVTSLLFPVATTWGTFLHAAAPVHVLLVISALGALDGGFTRLSRRLDWTRQVTWLGAVLAAGGSALFALALLPAVGVNSRDTARQYAVLGRQMAALGAPFDGAHPVIHDFPIWLAETERVPALALPDESPSDVLDLADTFGARWLVVAKDDHGDWPGILDTSKPIRPRPVSTRSRCPSPRTRTRRPRSPASASSGWAVPAASAHSLPDRGPGAGAVTATLRAMDTPRSEPAGTPFDGLHAEAAEALAYAANTLRAVRDRYRTAYLDDLVHWQALADDLGSLERTDSTDGGLPAADGDDAPAAGAAEAGAADLRLRMARGEVQRARGDLGRNEAQLSRLELAIRNLESTWLFIERGDASLVGEPSLPAVTTELQMRILEAQEAERARLAQEVHDGPAQALSNAIFQVELVDRVFESDPRMARTELRFLRELLRRELGDVRSFLTQLRPPVLDELGLDGAIADTLSTQSTLSGLHITSELAGPVDGLTEATQTVVLRVVQEALQNVRKHAGATNVVVMTRVEDGQWMLEVRDDGRGFDTGAVAARGRRNFGLQFMRERAELVGAQFEVRSRPEAGTVVRLAIPLTQEGTG